MSSFRRWLRLDEAYHATFFHGTQLASLPQIMQQGLKPFRMGNWTVGTAVNADTKAVYFSPDLATAARYAVGAMRDKTPVVIEFDLSGLRRFKRVDYDPMDRPEDSWDENGSGDTKEREIIYDIEQGLRKVAEQSRIARYWVGLPSDLETAVHERGLSALDGFNVYRFLLQYIQANMPPEYFRQYRAQVLRSIQDEFRPGPYCEYVSVTPSGTLRVDNRYYSSQSQFRYSKGVPPAAFKAVWVRHSDFAWARGQTDEIEPELLPGEAKDKLEELRALYEELEEWAEGGLGEDDDPSDLSADAEEWIERLRENDPNGCDDAVSDLQAVIDAVDEDNGEEIAAALDRLHQTAQACRDETYEQWGNSMKLPAETWVRLPIGDPQVHRVMGRRSAV